jgi:hypothetical protein
MSIERKLLVNPKLNACHSAHCILATDRYMATHPATAEALSRAPPSAPVIGDV